MVIGPNGEQLGVKPIKGALTLASYAGFDLVLINPNGKPAVCKIMDYNKYKYESKKKAKENMKKQRENNLEMKEYRLSVTIDVHDFEMQRYVSFESMYAMFVLGSTIFEIVIGDD